MRPQRSYWIWIELVIVLRVDSTTLYDRLKARNYAEAKLQENLDSEIMEVILQEAQEAFDEDVVIEMTSNSADEMESNLDRIEAWVEQWRLSNNAIGSSETGDHAHRERGHGHKD
ncbi:hypothetical protein CDD83_6490 [Cordyceps sp. RAO-2017]|nr:hypothetical protein CDD83_6490 [Cordyceps sp. RAO-2017]